MPEVRALVPEKPFNFPDTLKLMNQHPVRNA